MSEEKPTPKTQNETKEADKELPKEKGGFENRPEPTRYGDWDVGGRCSDF